MLPFVSFVISFFLSDFVIFRLSFFQLFSAGLRMANLFFRQQQRSVELSVHYNGVKNK
jgi:hypothetical protein